MSQKPKILLVNHSESQNEEFDRYLRDNFELVEVRSPLRALAKLGRENFDSVYVASAHLDELARLGRQVQTDRILQSMPDGVVLLDNENQIIWSNQCLRDWCGREDVDGKNFYDVLDTPEILGPDFCPFHTAISSGVASSSTLRTGDNRYFQLHVAPIFDGDSLPNHLIVTLRHVTSEILQQQKLAAIHKAGMELADLKPDELLHMTVEERIDLLKSNIVHFTGELLNYNLIEIRLLDRKTGQLDSLLAVGMEPEAESRELCAQSQHNGVTGFVAATGKSYLCEDTSEDPLYLPGAKDAKSSLTVPLISHDEVIGTFNVENPDHRAFDESDLQFLEIFSRDVAQALGTLELLVAEKVSTATESIEAIHTAVALPIDDILNEAVNVMERYIGHEPEVVARLEKILRNARDIKQVIQKVGQQMTPSEAVPASLQPEQRPLLAARRFLVVDDDASVRSAAHALLERYECAVETAHNGSEAMSMVRRTSALGA
ncbi:MAG: GAF domain-containing protein, partial [Pirellulales bacterium]